MLYLFLSVLAVTAAAVAVFAPLIRKEARRIERRERGLCRNCGYDLRAAGDCCPECGLPVKAAGLRPAPLDTRALLHDWPAESVAPRQPEAGEVMVTVHATRNTTEAEFVSKQFQARGVWCQVETDGPAELSGRTGLPVRTLLVMVPSADERAARAILDRLRKPIPAAGTNST